MRNISFALTTPQFLARTKRVTRRNGWRFLKGQEPVDLMGVEKGMGLMKGEKVQRLGAIRVLDVRFEPLSRIIDEPAYGAREVILEGFPDMTPEDFVAMYCRHNNCTPSHEITRIHYDYV